uniref:Uncharacterized protein n=1 Tax=Siphoviridae sp. ctkhg5 TaxID=2825643 RepID=A0A8S5UD95_9CAUD|nr:MAG TPA: hypothetical protein [Siphoviridae sp. ctkhg5]
MFFITTSRLAAAMYIHSQYMQIHKAINLSSHFSWLLFI